MLYKIRPRLRVLGKIAAMRGWALDKLTLNLEEEPLQTEHRIPQLLAEMRSLPLEAVVQVVAVALETLVTKSMASQTSKKSVQKAVDTKGALSA